MSDAAAIVIMAVIFAFGVVATALLVITIVPGVLLVGSKLAELRDKRRESPPAPSEHEPS